MISGIAIPMILGMTEAANTNSCTACISTPTTISQINDFTREILSNIKTIGPEWTYAGKPVPTTRFENGTFDPPSSSVISKALRRARQWLGSVVAIQRILLSSRNQWNEALDSKTILVKGKAYQRDRNKEEDLQQEINNKKFAVSVWGGWSDPIRSQTLKNMQKVVQTYIADWLLDKTSEINGETTYSDILTLLNDINIRTKHQIVVNGSSKLKETISRWTSQIVIKDTAVNDIGKSYACLSAEACNSGIPKLQNDLKNIRQTLGSGKANAWAEIAAANARIEAVRANNFTKTKAATDPEMEALKNRYGLKAKQIKDASLLWFKSDKRRSQLQSIKDEALSLKDGALIAQITDFAKWWLTVVWQLWRLISHPKAVASGIVEGTKTAIKEMFWKETNPVTEKNTEIREFNLMMTNAVTDVLQEADQQREYVLVAQNADVLTRFWMLNRQLTDLTNTVGAKSQTNTLIQNLGEVCTNQCSNLSNKKCYY